MPKEKVTFIVAKGDQIWNHCAAIVASAPAAWPFLFYLELYRFKLYVIIGVFMMQGNIEVIG